ncbi:C2H2-type domain-containing protein [Caenorhabditis elegans]|nr:C2H2-type domain-containing protein [Caenorhabditis elegans]CAB05277.2 C2H2-type domain-containing protein [Caenorhabditis elegans]|eukprot:NP_501948.2 Zinc finger In Meiosis [Caenorhabditis elegans]
MTCDDWNSYIQVNIYGKTIEGLQQQGVVLESLLNNVGCSKVWIMEGSVCTNPRPESSTHSEESTIEPVVPLSTTLATNKLPRFSTPAIGHSNNNSSKNFTLNLAEKLSEILSDDDKTDEFLENSHQSETSKDDVIKDLLEEMVQTVANSNKPPILLSTTLANVGVPRFSTPIKPQHALNRDFTMNMTEMISEIDSNYEGYELFDDSSNDCTTLTPNCQEVESSFYRALSEAASSIVPYQEGKRRSSRRLSTLSSLKETVKVEPAVSKLTKRRRLTPVECSSETMIPHSQPIPLDTCSDQPIFPNSTHNAIQSDGFSYEQPICEFGDSQLFLSAKSLCTEPNSSIAEDVKPVLTVSDSDITASNRNNIDDHNRVIELSTEHKTMGEFQYNFDDEDTVLIGNYEEVGTEIDEADEQHNEENSEDDEEDESPIPSKKRVSFAVPLVQSRSKQKDEMNKVHIIKCHFDKCNKSYNWRKKYGKLRLVDHAFTHVPHLKMKCNFCDYMCKGIRNIRLHHKKSHPDEQLTGFGIKSVVRTSKKGKDLAKVWDECFKKNRVLQHGSGTDSNLLHFSRQDKGSKRSQKSMDSGAKQKLDEARDEDVKPF